MNTFKKNVSLMYGAHFLKMLFPLLLFPIVARSISQSDFGLFVFYQTITIVVSCIVEYGFAFTAVSAIASSKKHIEIVEHVNNVEKSKFIICILLILLSIVYVFFSFDLVFLLAVISGCVSGVTANYYYQGKEDFQKITKYELLGVVAYYSISLLCMYYDFEYYWLIIAYSISRFVVYLGLSEHIKLINMDFSIKESLLYLKNNFIFFVHRSSFVIYSTMSIFIVEYFLGKSELALYSAAEKIVFVLCGLIQPIQQVLLPYLSKYEVTSKMRITFFIMLSFSFIISISTPLYSKELFQLYYGKELYQSYNNFNYLIWLFPLKLTSSMILVVFFLSKNKARPFSKVYTKLVFISLISSIISVNFFGIFGMIINIMMFEVILILLSIRKIESEKIKI